MTYNPFNNGMEDSQDPWDRYDERRAWNSDADDWYEYDIQDDTEVFTGVEDLSADLQKPAKKENPVKPEPEPKEDPYDETPTKAFPIQQPRVPSLARLMVGPSDGCRQLTCVDGTVLHITGCTPAAERDHLSPRESRFARKLGLERDLTSGPFSLVTVYACSDFMPEFNEWLADEYVEDPYDVQYVGIPFDLVRRAVVARGGELLVRR